MTIERWDDDKLDKFASIVQQAVVSSNERMTRIEEGLGRIEQTVESNNRFLESFSQELRNYTNSMNNLAARIDGTTATSNQDRLDVNSRLARIQTQVSAIANHLGIIF